MLVPEFWQWFGWILAGLCIWSVVGLAAALLFGRMCRGGREDDDE